MRGYAPNWVIRCPRCGRSGDAAEAGVVRIGAASNGKRVLGRCQACGRLRWLVLEKLTDAERIEQVLIGEQDFTLCLADGRRATTPFELMSGLRTATPKQRAAWQLSPSGLTVQWPEVDVRLCARSLLVAPSRLGS